MATRSTQISDSRSLLDEPAEAFFLDSEIVRWLNEADQIFATEIEPYEYSTTMTVTANRRNYSAPAGISRIKAVYYKDNLLDVIDTLDEATYTNSGVANAAIASSGLVSYYRLFGTQILLFPTPTTTDAAALRIIYFGAPPSIPAASSAATSQIPTNFHDAAPLYVAFKGKLKRNEFEKAASFKTLFDGRVRDAKRNFNPRHRAQNFTVRDEDDLDHTPYIFEKL